MIYTPSLYALIISILIAINLFWHDLLVLSSWNISWAIRILSEINLPGTNADCVSDICLGRHDFNLWHETLEMILYHTLQRLINLSSVILVGHSVLGIMQIFVLLSRGSISLVTKKLLTRSSKSFLIIGKECWKKIVVIPFGPRAFPVCIFNIARLTSSFVAFLNKIWFMWKVILHTYMILWSFVFLTIKILNCCKRKFQCGL